MFNRPHVAAALVAALTLWPAAPAFAVDGEILITHAKALAGNVTPGDTAGYPVTVSIPGRFKLASNLFVAANKIGIQVTGANATIDLNGFTMQGSNAAWHGITGGVDGVTIRNGTITRFQFDGINGAGQYWVVADMQVLENGRYGIALTAQEGLGRVLNSTVSGNTYIGITCVACLVQGNVVGNNGSIGITTAGASILGNLIYDNGGVGASLNGGGYGQNTVIYNDNNSTNQVNGGDPIDPNYCYQAC